MVDLRKIYDALKKIENSMVTRDEMDRFIETIEILSNNETMAQIKASEKNIILGNLREINSVREI